MTDDLIEAVARAIDEAGECRTCGTPCGGYIECDCERPIWQDASPKNMARAAIRAAAPLILDMAAEKADSFIEDDPLDTAEGISSAIRQLKERFQ